MIPAQSHHIPEGWKRNDPRSIERWMGSLPTVYDIDAAQRADDTYRKLLILNEIKR